MSPHLVDVFVAVGVLWIGIPLAIIAGVAWASWRQGRQ